MTAFLQRASQQYAARGTPYRITANIPAGLAKPVTGVKITAIQDPANPWPDGAICDVRLTPPNGGAPLGFTFNGGIPVFRGQQVLQSSCLWQSTTPFDAGSYALDFLVLQTVSAALLIEYFQ